MDNSLTYMDWMIILFPMIFKVRATNLNFETLKSNIKIISNFKGVNYNLVLYGHGFEPKPKM